MCCSDASGATSADVYVGGEMSGGEMSETDSCRVLALGDASLGLFSTVNTLHSEVQS